MHVVLRVIEVWGAVDAVLLALWIALRANRRRTEVGRMIRDAERHANRERPGVLARTR